MKYKILFIIILILIIAGVIYSLAWPGTPLTVEDTRGYLPVAEDLADGHVEKLHFRTLGYPLVLLLTGSAQAPTRGLFCLQLVMHLAAVLMLASILIQERIRAWVITIFVILALLPPAIEYISIALPETTTLFLLSTSLFCIYHSLKRKSIPWSAAAGFCLAFTAITRPDYQLYSLFLGIFLALFFIILGEKRVWLRSVLPLLLVSIIGIGAYIIFNYVSFQFPGIAYYSGITSTAKTVTMLEEIPDSDAGIREILIRHRNTNLVEGESHTAVNYIFDALPELEAYTGLSQPELSAKLNRLNMQMVMREPLNYLLSVGKALAVFLMPSATTQSIFGLQILQILWTAIHFASLALFLLLVFSLIGGTVLSLLLEKHSLIALRRRLSAGMVSSAIMLVSVLTMVYVTLVSILLSAGDPRYHVPAAPIALLGILLFIQFLLDQRKKRVSLVIKD